MFKVVCSIFFVLCCSRVVFYPSFFRFTRDEITIAFANLYFFWTRLFNNANSLIFVAYFGAHKMYERLFSRLLKSHILFFIFVLNLSLFNIVFDVSLFFSFSPGVCVCFESVYVPNNVQHQRLCLIILNFHTSRWLFLFVLFLLKFNFVE